MKLEVKRETFVRSMNKESFNDVFEDGTQVQILKVNTFKIKGTDGNPDTESNSFVVKLTPPNGGRRTIANLKGKTLFSAMVLNSTAEAQADETKDESYQSLYETFSEKDDEVISLADFENFTVVKHDNVKERRPNILALQGDKNPNKFMYALQDYASYGAELQKVKGVFADLNFDAIYASGPATSETKPLKTIYIKK
jgi:hypothetical protein